MCVWGVYGRVLAKPQPLATLHARRRSYCGLVADSWGSVGEPRCINENTFGKGHGGARGDQSQTSCQLAFVRLFDRPAEENEVLEELHGETRDH